MNSSSSEAGTTTNRGRPTTSGSISVGDTARRRENQFVIAKCRRNEDNVVVENGNGDQSNDDRREDESDAEDRVLAVYWRSGKLGAAYFTVQTGELFILDEIADRPPGHQILESVLRLSSPAQVLVDGKGRGSFVTRLQGAVEGTCQIRYIKAKEYNFEACKRRTYTLSLPSEPTSCSAEERALYLRTIINYAHAQTVHALGALLRYIDLHWSDLSMELHTKPHFMSLRKISLADIVTIDEDTYRGLQIFSTVSHPSNFKNGVQGSNKEGLSLYNMFSKCCSKVGQSWMRTLLQHPSNDMSLLKARQDVVEYFTRGHHDTIMRNICSSMRYIKNVHGILAKIKALSAKPYQWKSLYNTLYNAVLICEMCENVKGAELLEKLGSCDNNKLYEMALYMNRIIDFDASKLEGKFTVKTGVDPELDRKKQTMWSLHELMSSRARVELSLLPASVAECAMLYMPHLGYLLAVRGDAAAHLPGARFMFQNEDYCHYKSKGCEELDVMIGDTYPEIVAHETRIMMRLTAIVMENLHTLASVIEQCAQLDCLIAIAKVSRELNFVRPELTLDKTINIKQGRHPLHLASCDTFVPNDYISNEGEGVVKILTGPNASGKSVYMKQVGLIAYLAHIGSFVPAESATVGMLSHIYSRIQSTECVANHMSAFLIDLRQMSLALQESTSNSLIIIDEFGKGTAEIDGIALLASCVNTLVYRESQCPHVLLATHTLQLPDYIISTDLVRYQTFTHIMNDGLPVFLYRVTEGTEAGAGAGSGAGAGGAGSLAGAAARGAGLADYVVARAAQVASSFLNNELPVPNKKITSKLKAYVEMMKTELLSDDV